MNKFNFTHNKRAKTLISLISLIIVAVLIIIVSFLSPVTASRSGYFFNTNITITINDKPKKEAELILDECMNLCEKYENIFSKTIENSDVYRINVSNGEMTTVQPETIDIMKIAINYAKESDMTVDPSVGTLTSLWNILDDDFTIPTEKEINKALESVDYKNIRIDESNNSIQITNSNTKIDLGFIAKGYIADRIKEYLISQNVNSAIINLGGNILCVGSKKDGSDFNIGINDPMNSYLDALTVIPISDKSVVSSGPYERNIKIDGEIYHHIISLKNGYPAKSDLSQVTIISDNSVDGDALSTICFILGYDKATSYLKKYHPSVEAIFVDLNGNIINTKD